MTNTITRAKFNTLSKADRDSLIAQGYVVSDVVEESVPAESTGNKFAKAPEVTQTVSEFEIVGDSVYLNVIAIVLGQRYRLKGVKLTDKSMCCDSWVKGTNGGKGHWEGEHSDTMSLIEMVRTYGSEKVNEALTGEISLGKAGEKPVSRRDAFAIAEQAKAALAE